MRWFRDLAINRKLMVMTVGPCVIALGISASVLVTQTTEALRRMIIRDNVILAEVLARNCTAGLAFEDREATEEILASLKSQPHVVTATVLRGDGSPFAAYGECIGPRQAEDYESNGHLQVTAKPIVLDTEELGRLVIEYRLDELNYLTKRFLGVGLVALVASLAVAIGLSWFVRSAVSSPILNLARISERVAADRDYRLRAPQTSRDEVGRLVVAFNGMLDEIERNIAERTKAEASLRALNEDLEKKVAERTEHLEAANKELEAFSYSVSHDLRAPLRHVSGFGDLLATHSKATLDEKGRSYLDRILAAARQMGMLIDDLLNFSRMGRSELQTAPVSLDAMVQGIIATLQEDPEGHRISWKVEPLPEVHGDASLLKQVLINLLSNAVKFSKGSPNPEVSVRSEVADGEVIICIKDNGVGFDMQYAAKLFGVFQRLHSKDEFPGTGIGLANVRRIISRHGGRTWAEGKVDEGATFFFSMPLKEAA